MKIEIDPATLEPIIDRAVTAAIARAAEAARTLPDERLAFSEQEAARLIGLSASQLRDCRLAGRIKASQVWGRRIRYTRDDLLGYLAENKI